MITYICGSMIKYSEFPDAFWKDVDKLMTDGDEILLGTSDFDHRVYGRCRNRLYKNVSVMRENPKKRRRWSEIESALPSYVCMLRKCDHMIAVWDGESQVAFVNILMLLSLQKTCRMYYLPTGECVEIGSVDEFKQYVPDREGWTKDDMEEVLRTCGFEGEMLAYWIEAGLLPETLITEIISRAPVSIDIKLEMLEKLQMKNNLNHEAFSKVAPLIEKGSDIELVKQEIRDNFSFGSYISKGISDINRAKQCLKDSTFYLFIEWYDTDVFIEKSYPIGLFRSMKNVMKRIEHEENYLCDDSEEDETPVDWWYRLEVWTADYGCWGSEDTHEYNFYIFNGEICWFERLREEQEEDGAVSFMCEDNDFFGGRLDLNMDTPFKLGDIVNIDCTPFGPPFHALIFEARDQFDCCFPQVIFRMPFTDRWSTSSLKHKHFYKDAELSRYEPVLSPLYRLRKVKEDELAEDDELLIRIRKELKDEETGIAFWNAITEAEYDGISAEEVLKIWESVRNLSAE